MPLLYIVLALIIVAALAQLVNTSARMPENARPFINVVLALIVVGIFLWLINTYVPMAESIKVILNVFVVVATCVGVLQAVGLWSRAVGSWNGFLARRSAANLEKTNLEKTEKAPKASDGPKNQEAPTPGVAG